MEFRGVYLLWFLLPFWYAMLSLWVYLRPLFKVSGKEKVDRYVPSLFYASICFVLAIFIDQFGIAELFVDLLLATGIFPGDLQVGIVRFLLYPIVLVVVATLQSVLAKEDESKKRTLPKSKWYQ